MLFSAKKILVVDDEEMLRKILTKILTQAGYKVDTASNGEEAIEKIKAHPFDLMVTDIRMPVKDGSLALPAIESLKPKLKIILLTGYPLQPELEEKVAKGDYAYLTKPFDNQELIAKVQSLLASNPS